MTDIKEYFSKGCPKIDASAVSAFHELSLGDQHPEELTLTTSWDETTVDLTRAVKAAETTTHMHLSPDGEGEIPTALQFDGEHGSVDCISGDELSGIISLGKLKDVDQSIPFKDGDILMYRNGKWRAVDLESAVLEIVNGGNN